jgi:serine protease Do
VDRRPAGRVAVQVFDMAALFRQVLVLATLAALMLATGSARAQNRPDSFADLAERLLPAVVNISTAQTVRADDSLPQIPEFPPGSPFEDFFRDFFNRRGQPAPDAPGRRATALGSGFVIAADGYVVTNNHVIEGAQRITVVLQDNTTLEATLVGVDEKTDIAVLKVESDEPLPFVSFGDSNAMRVGDWVLAIGNPFGLGGSVTAGIISARARDINAGPYDDFLQTDASINRGNSGGPMFNLAGEVIGINTAIYSPSGGSVGIGFAIPSSLARNVVQQIVEFGHTRRGWLGVQIQTVTPEIAESLGLPAESGGALVAGTTPDGPAAKAGIEAGDVVLEFDGKPVTDMRRLPRLVAETTVARAVPVVIWRRGERREVTVTLGELEVAEQAGLIAPGAGDAVPDAPVAIEELGMTLSAITDPLREQYGIDSDQAGVVVTDVAADGPAAQKGLRPGDVIQEVGQEEVFSPADVERQVGAAREAGRRSVLLLILSGGELRFVALPTGKG